MNFNWFGKPQPPTAPAHQQNYFPQAIGGGGLAGQAWGGLQGAAANANIQSPYLQQGGVLGQAAAQQQNAVYGNAPWPPMPQFEENVPEDELRFEGILSRWPYNGFQPQLLPKIHTVACCQRMLML